MKRFKTSLLLLQVLAGTALAKDGIDLNRFSNLYERQKSASESLDRLRKMEDLRRGAQESLERLMSKNKTIELELRYGELIVQRGRDLDQFSLELGASGDLKQAKEIGALSKRLLEQGLGLHQKLLARVKRHPMAARVYLGMARTQYGLGQKPAALASTERGLQALRDTPNARLGDTEAQLWATRGDCAFDLAKAALALEAYEKARKLFAGKAGMEEAYLTYKLSWVHYNLKDALTAIAELEHLFEMSGDKFALKQEAVQDYALFLSDVPRGVIEKRGGWADVRNYLVRQSDPQAADKALERLGKSLTLNGRRQDAIELYEFLIAESPQAPANVDRALTIVEWSHTLANKKKLVERYFWLIEQFGPRSSWFAAQAALPQVQKTASDKIEASVRQFSQSLHQESAKESMEELRRAAEDVAAKLYDVHIDNFSRDTDVPRLEAGRIHYYRAEIHRRRHEYAQAGTRYDSYLRILQLVPKEQVEKIDKKLKEEAVWGSVQTWAKAIEKDPQDVPQMLAAADRFLKEYSAHPLAPQVLLDAAKVELKSNNSTVAAHRLAELVEKYPKTPAALEAVNAQLDILNKEGDWVNLAQVARRYMDSIDHWALPKDKAKVQGELYKILSQTEAKACEALSQRPDRQLESALCYEGYAKGFAKDALAPKALLNAAELYDKLKDPVAAVGALELLVKRYPESEYATRGFSRLAAVYEKSFDFEKAVNIYETLLTKNEKLTDREKFLTRLLTLLSGLGEQAKFQSWLDKKTTPAAIRKDFVQRQLAQDLQTFRTEELALGYDADGPVSPVARRILANFERLEKTHGLTLEQELEIRRARGITFRAAGRYDKADEQWQAGLKTFWRSKDHSPEAWESAARIRLEQASVWEVAFRNTDLLKSPGKKAELYQKLEKWYAGIIEMKSPVVALAALWASAQLNTNFAEEVRHSPVPPELMAAGLESQRAAYEKLIIERTEPMKQKALQIIERIAEKAKEWKVISPVVLTSLKVMSDLRAGVELPGQLVAVNDSQVLKFPWSELPRWMDLSAEQLAWKEWSLTNAELDKILAQGAKARSQLRRAAFITLARRNSLKVSNNLVAWSKTLADRPGIQLRIQAMISDRDLDRAALFLDQYESFYGTDAFSDHVVGRLEWARGNYQVAYLRWVRPSENSARDFRTVYWSQGWSSLLGELAHGGLSDSDRRENFERLNPLAKEIWQKQYLAKLCLTQKASCGREYQGHGLLALLSAPLEPSQSYELADGKSAYSVQHEGLASFVSLQLAKLKSYPELEELRQALSALYGIHGEALDGRSFLSEYWTLRRQVDQVQDVLDAKSKQRALAGAKE